MATRHAGSEPTQTGPRGLGQRMQSPARLRQTCAGRVWGRAMGAELLSAAFGGPCMYQGLMRVKSRFIFAYISYSSRSTAGDKGSALQ